MDYKEIWCEIYDELEAELEREPTNDEIESRYQGYCESIRGCYEE